MPSELKSPLSLNAVVAWNLHRARLFCRQRDQDMKAWTQAATGEKLKRYSRGEWTKANLSGAERSRFTGDRNFSANDLLAFSVVFDLPVAWFLMPPPGFSVKVGDEQLTPPQLIDAIFERSEVANRPHGEGLRLRIQELLADVPEGELTPLQREGFASIAAVIEAGIQRELGDVDTWISQLQELTTALQRVRSGFSGKSEESP